MTSGDPSRLPLFPLGTVLFPGVLLPLHVFEERYRRMIRDLLDEDQDRRDLGIVAIREGREVGAARLPALHQVGCVARLRRVDPYADGRFDIVCMGTSRFRLTGDGLDTSLPYLRARTELLDEPPGEAPGPAAVTVRALFETYREALGGDTNMTGGTDADDVPDDPRQLSYLVAATVVLDLADRQRLLEAPDTTARLRAETRLLRRETALVAQLPSLPGVELARVPASPN